MKQIAVALAAGLGSYLLPIVGAALLILTDTGVDNLGRPDDAPRRAAAGILLITPIVVIMLAIYFLLISAILKRLRQFTFRLLLIPSLLVAVFLGAFHAYHGFFIGGLSDAVISFFTFSVSAFIFLLIGTITFWRLSLKINNPI